MINTARAELAATPLVWWTLATAFGFMFLIVLSANLLADAVRDAFDPRTRLRSTTQALSNAKTKVNTQEVTP
jgi:peptide/nickel transport system permease protein